MSTYNIVLSTNESTVVTEYEPQAKRSDAYQSEAALEAAFIKMLGEQGYEYVSIHNEEDLVLNLRKQLERLNQYSFTDKEWETFFKSKIANANEGIVEKTRKIQEDYVQNLTCEDGRTQNIYLIDKKNIHNNRLQVINQYEEGAGNHDTRYDVTILVNGLPLVHVELKLSTRSIAIRETASGQVLDFMSMCRFLSSPMAHSQSIIPIPPEQAISKRMTAPAKSTARKLPIALSSLPIGQMVTTELLQTLLTLQRRSSPSIPC